MMTIYTTVDIKNLPKKSFTKKHQSILMMNTIAKYLVYWNDDTKQLMRYRSCVAQCQLSGAR